MLGLILAVAGVVAADSFDDGVKAVRGDTGYSIVLGAPENVLASEGVVNRKARTLSGYEISVFSTRYNKVEGAWGGKKSFKAIPSITPRSSMA